MPLNGEGGYNPPSPENPVRAGTLIKSDDFNTTIDDIAEALSTALYRDGQAVLEADLNAGHNNIVNVASLQNTESIRVKTPSTLRLEANEIVFATPSIDISALVEDLVFPINISADGLTLGENGITLRDGKQVLEHCDIGGAENAGKSIIANQQGLLDLSFQTLQPTQNTAMYITADEALEGGDFVGVDSNGHVLKAVHLPQSQPAGFVLDDCPAGGNALVYFVGFNNKVRITGEVVVGMGAYLKPDGSGRDVNLGGGSYYVGVVVSPATVRFVSVGNTGLTAIKAYYYGAMM